MKRLWRRIEDVLAGKLYLDQELAKASSSSLSNKEELFTVATRILVDNNASASDTVIEVNGRDRLGFLYDVTTALNDCGLKISSAHITTFGEHVVDTFYVKDVFGLKVTHDGKIDQIRKKLVSAVEQAYAENESAAAE